MDQTNQRERDNDMQKASLSTVDNIINMLYHEEENFLVDCYVDTNGEHSTVTIEYVPTAVYYEDYAALGRRYYQNES